MVKIYCGDQKIIPDGYDRRGTRFRCLQKGVGIGMGIEQKANGEGKTKAIQREGYVPKQIYCGYKGVIPPEYKSMGTHYQCLKKGVGVGIFLESKKRGVLEEGGELKEVKEEKEGKRYVREVESGIKHKKKSIKKNVKKSIKKSKKISYREFVKLNYSIIVKKRKSKQKSIKMSSVMKEISKLWIKLKKK